MRGFAFLPSPSLLSINVKDCNRFEQEWEKLPLCLKGKILVAGDLTKPPVVVLFPVGCAGAHVCRDGPSAEQVLCQAGLSGRGVLAEVKSFFVPE